MRKVIYILLILISSLCLTSCDRPTLEEVTPLESDYAMWDGNYIYFDNYRCKTDGSFEEQLITEINYNDEIFVVEKCCNYLFVGNDIYYLLLVSKKETNYSYTFFVKYSILEKNVEVIYYKGGHNYHYTFTLSNNQLLLSVGNIVKYNLITRKLEVFDRTDLSTFLCWNEEHLVVVKDNKVYLTYWDKTDMEYIEEYNGGWYDFIKVSDKDVVTIRKNETLNDKNETLIDELQLYDIENKKIIKIIDFTEQKDIVSRYNEYFVIGKRKYYGKKDKGYEEDNNVVNCVLYKFEYVQNELTYKTYELNSDKQYIIKDIAQDVIKFEESYFSSMIFYYHEDKNIRYYDMNSKKLTKNTSVIFEEEISNEINYNNKRYVIESVYLGGLLNPLSAYYLYQIDENQNKSLMQFFTSYDTGVNKCSNYFCDFYVDNNNLSNKYYKIFNY